MTRMVCRICLGRARVSHAGFGVVPKQSIIRIGSQWIWRIHLKSSRSRGRARQHARRALPNLRARGRDQRSRLQPITDHFSPIMLSRYPHGRGCGVGRSLGIGFGLGVGVGRIVAVGVAEGVGEGVGVTVGVGVGVGVVGGGVGVPPCGAWISTVIGAPVLKNPTVALTVCGGW
jgi:hypothetical protein